MTINTSLCDSYKVEIVSGVHRVDDEYRMALYGAEANLNSDTRAYTTEGEVAGQGYEAGGIRLTGAAVQLNGGAAILSFDPPEWSRATIAAGGCLIYNASKENRAVAVFGFGGNVVSRNGKFVVNMPTGGNGLIRIK
jgi:hypothetical protein